VTLLTLLLAAQMIPIQPPEVRVEQTELLETFRSICLAPSAETGGVAAPAVAAGFSQTEVTPTGFEWIETASWKRGGIRLFQMTDPREQNPSPMCGVSASVVRSDTDQGLIETVQSMANAVFGEGHRAHGISDWTLARRGGAIRIEIDRSGAPEVRVRLIAWPIKI
jgi:hypothetical protein